MVRRGGLSTGTRRWAKRATVVRSPVDGAWLGCPAVSVPSGGVGGSRLSDVGVSCKTSRRHRGSCDGALAGLQQLLGPQHQRRCISGGSNWGARQGAPEVGKVSAEKLQEVGCWMDLTNSGVVKTTFELASVLPLP